MLSMWLLITISSPLIVIITVLLIKFCFFSSSTNYYNLETQFISMIKGLIIMLLVKREHVDDDLLKCC